MDEQMEKIRKYLKKKLDPYRYEHTLGVACTCQALAMRYGCDLRQAKLAGLLHDCAKRFDDEAMLAKCLKHGIPITAGEEANPSLLHAKLGAWYAREKFGVEDEEILSAIACHTTGKEQMSLLDKILYVADFIEPGRTRAENLPEMRKLAFLDLDQACLSIMEGILSYLKLSSTPIDQATIAACIHMRQAVKQNKEETTVESADKGNGKTRSRCTGRQKRRKYQDHRH